MGKILCIEDGKDYQLLIESALRGFETVFCSTLSEGKKLIEKDGRDFSLIILDVSLPDGNGIRFLSEIKLDPGVSRVPVFVVTMDRDIMSKVTAFGVGVDDYIVKPFETLELRARVEAKMKHLRERESSENRIQFGDLMVDLGRMQVSLAGNNISDLTPIEFKMVAMLTRRPDHVFSRNQIMDEVWGLNTHITDRTIDAHISHLRKKIAASTVEISTVLGTGYKASLKGKT